MRFERCHLGCDVLVEQRQIFNSIPQTAPGNYFNLPSKLHATQAHDAGRRFIIITTNSVYVYTLPWSNSLLL